MSRFEGNGVYAGWTWLGFGSLLIAVLIATPATAGHGGDCPEFPDTVVLGVGEPLRFGDLHIVVGSGFTPEHERRFAAGSAEPEDAGGTTRSGVLDLDVRVARMDPVTREPRRASMVPGLDVSFVLRNADRVLTSGAMEYRMTPRGPSYGVTVPVSGEDDSVRLDVTMSGTSPGLHDDDTERIEDCPEVPSGVRTWIDVRSLIDAAATESVNEVGIDQDGVRSTLISAFDPRPSDSYSDVWGYDDGVTYLAILGYTQGTLFIDVTDPSQPVVVGDIAGPNSSWRDMKTYTVGENAYAYIGTEGAGVGEGVQVVDITDPLNPLLVNTYDATLTTSHNLYIDADRGHLWVWGTGNGTRILDIATDPVNPVEVGSFTSRYVHDGYVRDHRVCLSEINNDRQEIGDSTDVTNISILSSWPTPGGATHNCWADDTWNLLATTDEATAGHIALYDVADPGNPSDVLGEYQPHPTASVHNVKFDDQDNEVISMAYYALGWKYVDVHRPSAPVEWAGYDTYPSGDSGFNGAWGIYSFDPRGYDYISDISTGLYVLEYQPTGGTLSGIVRDAVGGDPVPGARVVVLADGTETFSTADGVYATYANAGDIRLRVGAWRYRTAILDAGTMSAGGRLDSDVELARLPQVGLQGIVRRSDDSAPIDGATVRIAGTDLQTTTGADGSYLFSDVAVGQQIVTAEAFGYSSGEGRAILAVAQPGMLDLILVPARFADDAETDRSWTLGVLGDNASSGVWSRVDPNGTGGGNVQPEDDHSPAPGVTAFITGQSNPGASTETNDVEGGTTTLLSPRLDASGLGAAQLRYQRWVSSSSGFFSGGQMTVQISDDDGQTWNVLESVGNANLWTARQFDLESLVTSTDRVRVRFRAVATTGLDNYRVLECGVDDLELVQSCGARFNASAPDRDGDGTVDGCDACALDSANDADDDGVCGDVDNSPFTANVDQADDDGDGVGNGSDNCIDEPNAAQRDQDGDGIGNLCDADLDGDGIENLADADRDGDGIDDTLDLCRDVADTLQADDDGDGQGNACDDDDGVVQGVRVAGDRVSWEPEQGADGYNLYRGDLGAPALLGLAACRSVNLVTPYAIDIDLPAPGDGSFYLVAAATGGVENSLGRSSDGAPRVVHTPCP